MYYLLRIIWCIKIHILQQNKLIINDLGKYHLYSNINNIQWIWRMYNIISKIQGRQQYGSQLIPILINITDLKYYCIYLERHLQRKVHLRVCFLQMHCFVLQGVYVLHWHSITLIKTSGAILVPSGVTLGRRMSNPSGEYHPNSVVINWGGSGFRQTFIVAAARWALSIFCLNNTSVGGRDLSFGGSKTFRAIFFSHVLTHASS